ncbi:GNAT family N-acetyltransferase [Rubrimonas cliftonensis]|uniref:Putative acetyltransferase n=1 Tax=Rubrimonas cliftonensis TaxID=89524 RepID=A0A1H4E089_9RHOB|nr:GNAT family N-acetyltransferase [Rubrimonas cliftonensis]SEA77832.1 putative acetyltransferase [Rubrimonas cliftonensis]
MSGTVAPTVAPWRVESPEALALIAQSEAELAAIYPAEVRFAFSPQELVAAKVRFVVAWLDGAPAGCGGVAPLEGYGELKRIFTTRAARGRGVGRAVVTALEAEALSLGLPLARLETGHLSPEAISLYTALGYALRGPFGDYAENGSSVFMEKRLAP